MTTFESEKSGSIQTSLGAIGVWTKIGTGSTVVAATTSGTLITGITLAVDEVLFPLVAVEDVLAASRRVGWSPTLFDPHFVFF